MSIGNRLATYLLQCHPFVLNFLAFLIFILSSCSQIFCQTIEIRSKTSLPSKNFWTHDYITLDDLIFLIRQTSNGILFRSSVGHAENGADHHRDYKDYEMERGDGDKIVISDVDDASSQVKSRADTYYGSNSPTGSCSISPLHISSPSVVTTMSDSLPPQIHVRYSSVVCSNRLPNTNANCFLATDCGISFLAVVR